MDNTIRRIGMMLMCALVFSASAFAQRNVDLRPYLQAEINEIAMLTAQSNYLQQQGDPLGAALVASYIADHQLQANMLGVAIQAQGGNPAALTPEPVPAISGTRMALIEQDLRAHQQGRELYERLARESNDATIQRLAISGQNGATRHFHSLQVAQAASDGSPAMINQSLIASLALERAAIADLQTQAAQLNALGDQASANTLMSMVPGHQQQAARLESMLTQLGGNPAQAVPSPTVGLPSREAIAMHQRAFDTLMVNTYALPIASLPESPLRCLVVQGQQVALAGLSSFQAQPIRA